MRPALESGDLLLGWRRGRPQVGQVVVARHGRPLVKRVARLDVSGVWLEGDNPAASTDSRSFGYLDPVLVEAVIVWPRRNASA
jgi:hypothetical protein